MRILSILVRNLIVGREEEEATTEPVPETNVQRPTEAKAVNLEREATKVPWFQQFAEQFEPQQERF